MKLQHVQRLNENAKTVRINLKTTPLIRKFMVMNSISPQKVFDMAMKELMVRKSYNYGGVF